MPSMTLSSADLVYEFMLKKLRQETSLIGLQMYESVKNRINMRRQKVLSTLQGYMENPSYLEDVQYITFFHIGVFINEQLHYQIKRKPR